MKKNDFLFGIVALILLVVSVLHYTEGTEQLLFKELSIKNGEELIAITDSLVVPVLYDTLIVDRFAPTEVRKNQFINQVLPAILIVRYQTEHKSKRVEQIIQNFNNNLAVSPCEVAFIDSMMKRYNAKSYENLLVRMKPHPTSLVLAQAIVESGWGQSRFAAEGYNLFGMWGVPGDPNILKSLYSRGEQQIFLKKYNSIAESIDHYFLTIGRNNAYKGFRQKRYSEPDVYELIGLLDKYSENGEEYILMLRKIIDWNNLLQYDHYQIDPAYLQRQSLLEELYFKFKTKFR
ncbi:MAG TPA: glucosaminidase domain-containing protein [Prolixibacteraceae bacterium]|nr:glucosaminidase domain-containing protein [Prolixibacteraceae bacterium]